MKAPWFPFALLPVLLVWLGPPALVASTAVPSDAQIVRLSLVQGDVRILRDQLAASLKDEKWEQAEVNTPVEQGFVLSTGEGRTEIEFEDNSTAYLGENSVLSFTRLTVTGGVPATVLMLISGTITLDLHPVSQESFLLRTRTDGLLIRYPESCFLRVNSYADAMSVTPLEDMKLREPQLNRVKVAKGQLTMFQAATAIPVDGLRQPVNYDAWDAWVSARVNERQQALREALSRSGLTTPIPGLADLNSQGTFYACAPYGTCWQPHEELGIPSPSSGQGLSQASTTPRATTPQTPAPLVEDWLGASFPCSPYQVRTRVLKVPGTSQVAALGSQAVRDPTYDWALCHAGSWITRNHRYVWVAGSHKHHHPPCRWVKIGHSVGFVPIHPRDVKGELPKNLPHGIFVPPAKNQAPRELTGLGALQEIKVLDAAPKQLRDLPSPELARASTPNMVVHELKDFGASGKDSGLKTTVVPVNTALARLASSREMTMTHGGASGAGSVATRGASAGSSRSASGNRGGGHSSGGGTGGSAGGGHSASSGGGYSGGGGGSGGGRPR
jgi:hypothetical protein